MNTKDDLHELIHSLSKMEKRGFSIRAKSKGEDNSNYFRLFNALNGMDSYDEGKLKRKFKGEKLLKNLSKEKKYLFNAILKAMRDHRNKKAALVQIKELMMDADFLYEKGLYDPAQKYLSSAKELARKYEHFPSILEIIMQELLIIKNKREKGDWQSLLKLWDEKKRILRILEQKDEYESLFDHALMIAWSDMSGKEEQRKLLDELLNSPIMDEKIERISFTAQYRYYQFLGLYHHCIGNDREAQDNYGKNLACWQAYPHMIDEHIKLYSSHINNYIGPCTNLKDYDKISSLIEDLRSKKTRNHQEEGLVFSDTFHSELLLFMNIPKCEEAEALVPEIEAGLKKYKDVMAKSRILSFIINIAALYFILEQVDKAHKWYDRLIKESNTGFRDDLQRVARRTKLVLLYDAGELEEFDNYYRSVRRYFVKHQEMGDLDEMTFRHLKNLSKCTPNETKNHYTAFHSELKLYEKEKKSTAIGLGELILWTKSRLTDKSILDLLSKEADKEQSFG